MQNNSSKGKIQKAKVKVKSQKLDWDEIEKRFQVMKEAVKIAGDELLKKYNKGEVKYWMEKEVANDFATDADYDSEKIIVDTYRKKFPGDLIQSEELGEDHGSSKSGTLYQLIIDPLDGTANFKEHQGKPFTVNAALKMRGKFNKEGILAGVVYDPLGRDFFSARKNQGAFLNEKKIDVSNVDKLSKAKISVEKPEIKYLRQENFEKFRAERLKELAKLKSYRGLDIKYEHTGAWSICQVACGRYAAYVDLSGSTVLHDIAPALLILEEAGGEVKDLEDKKGDVASRRADILRVKATNGKLDVDLDV